MRAASSLVVCALVAACLALPVKDDAASTVTPNEKLIAAVKEKAEAASAAPALTSASDSDARKSSSTNAPATQNSAPPPAPAPAQDLEEDTGKVTVILMNWNRPEVLRNSILPVYQDDPLVKNVLVSHGKEDTFFETPELNKVRHFKHYTENNEIGLILRFLTAKEAKTDCIMYSDDDVVMNKTGMAALYNNWLQAPRVEHGVDGRPLMKQDGKLKYLCADMPNNEFVQAHGYDEGLMLLTSCAMVHKSVALGALDEYKVFDSFVKAQNPKPLWNGEDILLGVYSSYLNYKANPNDDSMWFPRIHRDVADCLTKVENTQEGLAISQVWKGHADFRTAMVQELVTHYEALGMRFDRIMRYKEATTKK